jgi:hypothetical protein
MAAASVQYIRRFGSSDTPLGEDVLVNQDTAGDRFHGRVAIASNGDFMVGWCSGDKTGNTTASVFVQAFAADGSRIGDISSAIPSPSSTVSGFNFEQKKLNRQTACKPYGVKRYLCG